MKYVKEQVWVRIEGKAQQVRIVLFTDLMQCHYWACEVQENDLLRRMALSFDSILLEFLRVQIGKQLLSIRKGKLPWWLRFHAPNAGGLSSFPGQGTRSHMLQLRPGAAK